MSHPLRSVSAMKTNYSSWCEHNPVWVGNIAVSACADCGQVEWFSDAGPIDPAEAMARLFGSYDLIGPLDAMGAPARSVLAYSPPSARKRKNLRALPEKVWLKASPHLWLSHDGAVLLLATDQQLLFENLTRGA